MSKKSIFNELFNRTNSFEEEVTKLSNKIKNLCEDGMNVFNQVY